MFIGRVPGIVEVTLNENIPHILVSGHSSRARNSVGLVGQLGSFDAEYAPKYCWIDHFAVIDRCLLPGQVCSLTCRCSRGNEARSGARVRKVGKTPRRKQQIRHVSQPRIEAGDPQSSHHLSDASTAGSRVIDGQPKISRHVDQGRGNGLERHAVWKGISSASMETPDASRTLE